MLVQQDGEGLPFNGRFNGGNWQLVKGRVIAKRLFQHATKTQRRTYVQERNVLPALAVWASLTGPEKQAWDEAAESYPRYDKGHAIALSTGKELFVSYNTNGLFFGTIGDWQIEPPEWPTWGERPEFSPFAFIDGPTSWKLTVTQPIAAGTKIAVYGATPVDGPTALNRNTLAFCGIVEFASALEVGDVTDAIGTAYASVFGSTVFDESFYQWCQLYEVDRGFMRILRDPCKPVVQGPPPGYARCIVTNALFGQTIESDNPGQFDLGDEFSQNPFYVPQWGPIGYNESVIIDIEYTTGDPATITVGRCYYIASSSGSLNLTVNQNGPTIRFLIEPV